MPIVHRYTSFRIYDTKKLSSTELFLSLDTVQTLTDFRNWEVSPSVFANGCQYQSSFQECHRRACPAPSLPISIDSAVSTTRNVTANGAPSRCQSVSTRYSLDHQSSLFAHRKLGSYVEQGIQALEIFWAPPQYHSSHHKIGKEDCPHGEGWERKQLV